MDEAAGAELLHQAHALFREFETERRGDDRRGQLDRLRRRLRDGDGLRLPDRGRGGGLRPAGDQAGDHPRLRRHPAAAAPGRRDEGAGDEPDRRFDPLRGGARNRPRQPGRPRPRAVRDGADVGGQAGRARRRSRSARSSRSRTRATSTPASRPRRAASPPPSPATTPKRASAPSSASARRSGAASRPQSGEGATAGAAPLPGRRRSRGSPRSSPRRRAPPSSSPAPASRSPPGSPTSAPRRPAAGRTSTRWRSPTSRLRRGSGALLVLLPAALPAARRQAAERRPRGDRRARAPRA